MTHLVRAMAILSLICSAALAGDVQPLLDRLEQAESRAVADDLTRDIWHGWLNSHTDADEQRLMRDGIQAMQSRDLALAERLFSELVYLNPDFTEAWNKRATVRFMAGDLSGSERDVAQVLAREPRHFGAISGLGLINLRQGDLESALRAYETLLQVNPFSPDAQRFVPELRARLGINDI